MQHAALGLLQLSDMFIPCSAFESHKCNAGSDVTSRRSEICLNNPFLNEWHPREMQHTQKECQRRRWIPFKEQYMERRGIQGPDKRYTNIWYPEIAFDSSFWKPVHYTFSVGGPTSSRRSLAIVVVLYYSSHVCWIGSSGFYFKFDLWEVTTALSGTVEAR